MNSGETLGPYRILEKVGEGGMGEVYRAEDARLHRTIAIKVLARGIAGPGSRERFDQEARAVAALNHPNILTIHDVGRHGGTDYIAMEWVDGRTLRDELRGGPLPHRRTIELAAQTADGLAAAHAAGVVHRDLKPENVMVSNGGIAKIVDFGLAKLHAPQPGLEPAGVEPARTHTAMSVPGALMGTVGYMSPEQASGRSVDYRSDQFALGLLIYELVSGRRPFARPTAAQTLAATIEDDPEPLASVRPDVPLHLDAIVRRLLAKNPAARYQSTRDLARELKSAGETAAAPPATGAAVRRPWVLLAAAAVVLAALAITAVTFWRRPASAAFADDERPLLAVRAFRSLSPDAQQAYFAAGITEEIRGQLSQISALRLLSRDGLDGYQDEPRRAVRELGLRHVVDGSVRVDGSRVRVSAELVDAASQQTLWSQHYDRDLAGILDVQSEIAQQIARALQASLSPAEQLQIEKRPTEDLEAYTLFLQSLQADNSDRAANTAAIDKLRQALTLDPRFALARAHLAYRLMFLSNYDSASYMDEAIREGEAAIAMDPDVAYGHYALGTAYGRKGLAARSHQAFQRALELDPNDTSAMINFKNEEIRRGRLDEALYWSRRSFLRSGKASGDFFHLAWPLINLRADAEARLLLEEAERIRPLDSRLQRMLAWLDMYEGHADRAVRRADAVLARAPANEEVKFFRADFAYIFDAADLARWLEPLMDRSAGNRGWVPVSHRLKYAHVLRMRGETAAAGKLIVDAERMARAALDPQPDATELRIEMAAVSALRQDTAAALEWLRRAYDGGYRNYSFLERDPILRRQMGTDPRFVEFIDRMRGDVAAQRERAIGRGLLDLNGVLTEKRYPARGNR